VCDVGLVVVGQLPTVFVRTGDVYRVSTVRGGNDLVNRQRCVFSQSAWIRVSGSGRQANGFGRTDEIAVER
jgi:hypothetical protein